MSAFSITHLSLVRRVRSGDADTRARAQDALAAVYWAPIYAHVRLTHQVTPQDAEDLTQGFFAEALRRDLFARYEPARARFRAYVRSCVDEYVDNLRKWERPLRRAGRWNALPLDLVELESRLTSDVDPDAIFHREWARSVLVTALGRLRERYVEAGKHTHLALFERYDIIGSTAQQRPTYGQLAAELEITISQATSWLAAARRDFRSIVLETLRDLSGNDEEYRAEARALLGVDSL